MTPRYPFEKITEVLLLLRDNDFNYSKTKEETGIAHATIKRWMEKYGKGIYDAELRTLPDPLKQKKAEVISEQKEVREKMNSLAMKIMDVAAAKLQDDDFVKKIGPKDLGVLIKEVVPFIIPKFEDGDKDGKNYTQVFNNFVNNTYNQLIQSGHEQRNNSIKGATKKLPGRDE
jgi:hypothetical protein